MRRLLLLSLSLPFTLAPFCCRRNSMYKMWKVFVATATAQMCIRDVQNVWVRAYVVSIDSFSRICNLPKFLINCQYSIKRYSRCYCLEYCEEKSNWRAHSSFLASLPPPIFTIQNEGRLRVDILISLELGASTWIYFSWSKMFQSRNNGRRFARFTKIVSFKWTILLPSGRTPNYLSLKMEKRTYSLYKKYMTLSSLQERIE